MLSPRVKSMLIPSAQSNTLLTVVAQADFVLTDPITGKVYAYETLGRYKWLLAVMFAGGLRVSEALSISSSDIFGNGQIRIRAAKGSLDKVIRVPELVQFLDKCRSTGMSPFSDISRFQVYRMFKQHSIGSTFGKVGNESVTHYPRKVYAQLIHNNTNDMAIVQRSVGHVSQKSTEYYVKTKQSNSKKGNSK